MDNTPVRRIVPFKLIVGSAILLLLALVLMNYLEKAHAVLEEQSVKQQKRVIESALVVVFATHAVEGRLHELHQLDGANPFEFLQQYSIAAGNYFGQSELAADLSSGWYYDPKRGEVFFIPLYLDEPQRLRVFVDSLPGDSDRETSITGLRFSYLE